MVVCLLVSILLFFLTAQLFLIWLKLIEVISCGWTWIVLPWFVWDFVFCLYVYYFVRTRHRRVWLVAAFSGLLVWVVFKLSVLRHELLCLTFPSVILWCLVFLVISIRFMATDQRTRSMVLNWGRKVDDFDPEDKYCLESLYMPRQSRNSLHHRKP